MSGRIVRKHCPECLTVDDSSATEGDFPANWPTVRKPKDIVEVCAKCVAYQEAQRSLIAKVIDTAVAEDHAEVKRHAEIKRYTIPAKRARSVSPEGVQTPDQPSIMTDTVDSVQPTLSMADLAARFDHSLANPKGALITDQSPLVIEAPLSMADLAARFQNTVSSLKQAVVPAQSLPIGESPLTITAEPRSRADLDAFFSTDQQRNWTVELPTFFTGVSADQTVVSDPTPQASNGSTERKVSYYERVPLSLIIPPYTRPAVAAAVKSEPSSDLWNWTVLLPPLVSNASPEIVSKLDWSIPARREQHDPTMPGEPIVIIEPASPLLVIEGANSKSVPSIPILPASPPSPTATPSSPSVSSSPLSPIARPFTPTRSMSSSSPLSPVARPFTPTRSTSSSTATSITPKTSGPVLKRCNVPKCPVCRLWPRESCSITSEGRNQWISHWCAVDFSKCGKCLGCLKGRMPLQCRTYCNKPWHNVWSMYGHHFVARFINGKGECGTCVKEGTVDELEPAQPAPEEPRRIAVVTTPPPTEPKAMRLQRAAKESLRRKSEAVAEMTVAPPAKALIPAVRILSRASSVPDWAMAPEPKRKSCAYAPSPAEFEVSRK